MHFAGQFERTLDDKGRVVLPSRLRDGLAGVQVLITDMGDRLGIWPAEAYEEFVETLSADLRDRAEQGLIDRAEINEAIDALWFNAHPIKPDSQGRVVVPDELLTDELRGSEVVMAGNKDHIDLYTAADFRVRKASAKPKVADVMAMRSR